MAETYDKGDIARNTAEFKVDGVLTDPTVVRVILEAPDGTSSTYLYGTHSEIVRLATGRFRFAKSLTDDGLWRGEWDTDGAAEAAEPFTWEVRPRALDYPAVTPVYATVQQLRDALAPAGQTLTDTDVAKLIVNAEDLIDRLLGAGEWWPDEATGRKVAQGDVEAWQWAKLSRATVLLAVRVNTDPSLLTRVSATTVKGPDFELTGPHGGNAARLYGTQVLAILDDSGLRRLVGRATPGRAGLRRRYGYDRFLRATRHNGT